MTCVECEDTGFIPFVWADLSKLDADVTADDLQFAVCLCETGQQWRTDRNCGRRVAPLWRVWCARHQVDPSRVVMVEQVYGAETLKAAGFGRPVPTVADRRAALLAEGNRVRV